MVGIDYLCDLSRLSFVIKNMPLILFFSGAGGKESYLLKEEAEVFADIAIANGVPKERIIKESQSTNTGENILFTRSFNSAGGNLP